MKLTDKEFIDLLQSEEDMENYLEQYQKQPHKIDSRIWLVHISVPKKKQMSIINTFIQKQISKHTIICNFLPKNMVLAKVYRNLNIPFSWNPITDRLKIDVKNPKVEAVKKYKRFYNNIPRVKSLSRKFNDVYEFNIERPRLGSFTEFRRQQQAKKAASKSATPNLFDVSEKRDPVRQKSSIHPRKTRKGKNKNGPNHRTDPCVAEIHASENAPPAARPAVVDINDNVSNIIDEKSGSRKCALRNKTQSHTERFHRIFARKDASDDELVVDNSSVSPVIQPDVDVNDNNIDMTDKESDKRRCADITKKQSRIEHINRVFDGSDVSDDGNSLISFSDSENEKDNPIPKDSDGRDSTILKTQCADLSKSTSSEEDLADDDSSVNISLTTHVNEERIELQRRETQELVEENLSANSLSTANSDKTTEPPRRLLTDSLNKSSNYEEGEVLFAKLFDSKSPSSCESNLNTGYFSTSKMASRPPLEMEINRGSMRPESQTEKESIEHTRGSMVFTAQSGKAESELLRRGTEKFVEENPMSDSSITANAGKATELSGKGADSLIRSSKYEECELLFAKLFDNVLPSEPPSSCESNLKASYSSTSKVTSRSSLEMKINRRPMWSESQTEIESREPTLGSISVTAQADKEESVDLPRERIEESVEENPAADTADSSITTNVHRTTEPPSKEADSPIRSSKYEQYELMFAKLYDNVPASESPSSCESDFIAAHSSTSKVALRPPLEMKITRRLRKPVRSKSQSTKPAGECGDAMTSTVESISSEIEQLVRDVSLFKMSAQKSSKCSDLPCSQNDNGVQTPPRQHSDLDKPSSAEMYDTSLKSTQFELANDNPEMINEPESDGECIVPHSPEVGEISDTCTKQLVPELSPLKTANEFNESSVQVLNCNESPVRKQSADMTAKQSPILIQLNSTPVALPTPESQCCIISDSQPSQRDGNTTSTNIDQRETEGFLSPMGNNSPNSKMSSTKLPEMSFHMYGSDSDEEALIFRTSQWPPLSSQTPRNTLNKSKVGEKATAPANMNEKPGQVLITIKNKNKRQKNSKDTKKLTDFIDYKIVKNSIHSKVKVETKASTSTKLFGFREKRKLYTDTDDEKLCGVSKRRRQSKSEIMKKAKKTKNPLHSSESELSSQKNNENIDCTFRGSESEVSSQKSKDDTDLTSFLAVSKKMELLSLRTSTTYSSQTSCDPRRTPISPALFAEEKITSPTKTSQSKSNATRVSSQQSSSSTLSMKSKTVDNVECSDGGFKGFSSQATLLIGSSVTIGDTSSHSYSQVSSGKNTRSSLSASSVEKVESIDNSFKGFSDQTSMAGSMTCGKTSNQSLIEICSENKMRKSPLSSISPLKSKSSSKMENSGAVSEGVSCLTPLIRTVTDDDASNQSFDSLYSGKKTMKYINDSVKACLNLPHTPDSLPSQYLSAFTSEKESDASPLYRAKKNKKVKTLKQRNLHLNYRPCFDSNSSSEESSNTSPTISQNTESQYSTSKLCKLYIPKEDLECEKRSQGCNERKSSLIMSEQTDSDSHIVVDINSLFIPPELCQNSETPVLPRQLENCAEQPQSTEISVLTQPLENSAEPNQSTVLTHPLRDSPKLTPDHSPVDHRSPAGGDTCSARKRIGFLTEDDYESDELSVDLNDNLMYMNFSKEKGRNVIETTYEDDQQSVVSFDYGDEIRKLMNEVDSFKKGQQEVHINPSPSSEQQESVGSTSTFQQMMWDSFPDSMETAMTTPEEKLQATQDDLKRRLSNNKDSQLLCNSAANLESSQDSSDCNLFASVFSD